MIREREKMRTKKREKKIQRKGEDMRRKRKGKVYATILMSINKTVIDENISKL